VRVLVVSHLYPWPGAERHLFVHQQTLALKELGVDVSVLSPTPYAPRLLWRSAKQRRRGLKPRQAVRDGIGAEYPRIVQPPRRILFDRVGDLAARRLRRLPSVAAGGHDLVHAHQALPDGAIAQGLAATLGAPYVVTVHGADVYQHLRGSGSVAARARDVLAQAAAVMANSSAVARLLAPVVTADRLHVVLNGTTGIEREVEPALDVLPGRPLLLTVGYLIERKGHGAVLEALGLLARRGLRPHWAIVGEGPLRDRLTAEAGRLGLSESVHFLGRLPHERVLALMSRAELFVLPSWDEAFGLVYTEAMAQGTPVVACRGEGPEDFIRDQESGYLVPPRDADALSDVIARVIEDRAEATRIGEAGRAAAAGLTWDRNARLTLDVYGRALGRRAPEVP
jgi:glycosyltransferase involved in cell wall biosynthesis